MNSSKNYIIPLLLFIIILVQSFFLYKKPKEIIKETVITDTQYVEVIVPKIQYVPKKEIVRVEVPIYIHTADSLLNEIVNKYYTKYSYVDTLKVSTYGNIVVQDTLYKNTITSRSIFPNITIPIIHKEITKYPKPVFNYYLGFTVNEHLYGPVLSIEDKQNRLYQVGYNFDSSNIYLGLSLRIK